MIHLITGLPGAGKTLFAIWHILQLAKRESRPVYYSGVIDLKAEECRALCGMPWIEIESESHPEEDRQMKPDDWFLLPHGAIIVIDEAQRVFRPRPIRSEPPRSVSMLETHRHLGHDLFLITQHPSLIDTNVRRLAGVHRHVMRTFGMQKSIIHSWGEVHLDCDRNRKDSSKDKFKYPPEIFGLYKSAELHTHGRSMPKQMFTIAVGGALILAVIFYFYFRFSRPAAEEAKPVEQASTSIAASFIPQWKQDEEKRPMTKSEYLESLKPRIDHHPHTAPRYDEVTKPVTAPYVSGCISMRGKCKCYTQQGTEMIMPFAQCEYMIAHNRPFYDFLPDSSLTGEAGDRESVASPVSEIRYSDAHTGQFISSEQKNYAGYNYGR